MPQVDCKNTDSNTHDPVLFDIHGRAVRYVRISLTDRCNFRCIYCSSCDKIQKTIPHDDILRYEELLELSSLLVNRGVEKIRLTGGEPFVRKGIMNFLERLHKAHPELLISLTSNGSLLKPYLQGLKDLGIKSLNISLDSLNPQRFEQITGSDSLSKVREAIDSALDIGLNIKINAVALRRFNKDELKDFLELAMNNPLEVRFIEYMPMGGHEPWLDSNFWAAEDILAEAKNYVTLKAQDKKDPRSGPAKSFEIVGGKGRFGLITPLSNHFCFQCNRLRITADGRLRTCLFSEKEYKVRELLRHSKLGIKFVDKLFTQAIKHKPIGFDLLEAKKAAKTTGRKMNAIGG
ncbi:GTP 3',8-cyclase MoaA [Desulfovibrio litoralis]|uniref:GTP 3',8-cyclase n=1 Tax=Desulfovibrio litoralis DSM 11393 TaxID=1121455 RepID=A0A1M7RVQ2_9BACT|nr:GTP 3',8-cyclase MoaA [Desulfovibrio litoralis]SHN50343.1 cyclic pyranopterin monophosphate synthase subunit MoaA [Desulfovibrio litoralis DSM 11393]